MAAGGGGEPAWPSPDEENLLEKLVSHDGRREVAGAAGELAGESDTTGNVVWPLPSVKMGEVLAWFSGGGWSVARRRGGRGASAVGTMGVELLRERERDDGVESRAAQPREGIASQPRRTTTARADGERERRRAAAGVALGSAAVQRWPSQLGRLKQPHARAEQAVAPGQEELVAEARTSIVVR